LEDELLYIEKSMPHILAVKNGLEKPRRCEMCTYCRETKKLPQVFDFEEMQQIYMFGYNYEDFRRIEE
jgi:electron transfer flavoprotein alpha/beta subunit